MRDYKAYFILALIITNMIASISIMITGIVKSDFVYAIVGFILSVAIFFSISTIIFETIKDLEKGVDSNENSQP